jgi:hypothetical protein
MDASTYGRLVERGGYATGGIVRTTGLTLVGESGPELTWLNAANPSLGHPVTEAAFRQESLSTWPDPDDGAAGVPARR